MTLRTRLLTALATTVVLVAPTSVLAQDSPEADNNTIELAPLSDEAIKEFIGKLETAFEADAKAAEEETEAPRRPQARSVLFSAPYIVYGLGNNRATSEEQVEMIVAELERLKEKFPSQAKTIDGEIFRVENLTIGREAPNIEGVDTDEVEFQLKDYRGKVVVIDFWGDW